MTSKKDILSDVLSLSCLKLELASPFRGEVAERSEVGGGMEEHTLFYAVFFMFAPSVAFGDSSPLKREPGSFHDKIYACSRKQITPLSTFMLSTMAMDSSR